MLDWSPAEMQAYVRGERAWVSVQTDGWRRTGNAWKAWEIQRELRLFDYGRLLAEKRFDEIERNANEVSKHLIDRWRSSQ